MVDDKARLTYESLYELVRREKSREELQKLDPAYFSALLQFLREQDARLAETAVKGDVFANSENEQLISQGQNTKRLVRELYERRERKIIDLAVNRSRTGSDLIDTSNLIAEERALFDMVVTSLDAYRRGILGNIMQLKQPEQMLVSEIPAEQPTVSPLKHSVAPAEPVPEATEQVAQPASQPAAEPPKEGMTRVRFTHAIEQFVGQELELYGPFNAGDEAELPTTVAEVLLAQKTAVEVKS